MWYLVGLGNPGKDYQNSRHNAGWLVLDELQHRLNVPSFSAHKKTFSELSRSSELTLIKPQTYMNDSGRSVRAVLEYYEKSSELAEIVKDHLVVLHDDLDLELVKNKLVYGKGPKIHNGLLSLYAHLQTDQFWHLRIGVDARQGERSVPGSSYVLQAFSPSEREIFNVGVTDSVSELLSTMGMK